MHHVNLDFEPEEIEAKRNEYLGYSTITSICFFDSLMASMGMVGTDPSAIISGSAGSVTMKLSPVQMLSLLKRHGNRKYISIYLSGQ